MHLSLNPTNAPSEARMCLRMGFTALRRIAQALHWEFDADPAPGGELQLTYEEFVYAVNLVQGDRLPHRAHRARRRGGISAAGA